MERRRPSDAKISVTSVASYVPEVNHGADEVLTLDLWMYKDSGLAKCGEAYLHICACNFFIQSKTCFVHIQSYVYETHPYARCHLLPF